MKCVTHGRPNRGNAGGRADDTCRRPSSNHGVFLESLPDGALTCAWFAGTLEGKPDIFIQMAVCLLAPSDGVFQPGLG